MDERCVTCFEKTYSRLLQKLKPSLLQQAQFQMYFDILIQEKNNYNTPEIQRLLFRKVQELTGCEDLFAEEKQYSAQQAGSLYDEWRTKVFTNNNPFNIALRLAIAANVIDYAANYQFSLTQNMNNIFRSSFAIDDSKLLQEKIQKAEHILYLADNVGELTFDHLFIETFDHKNVTIAVRDLPIINDATPIEAAQLNWTGIAQVISNGYDAPSTLLNKCSNEFLEVYNTADLIISKGQGNYEGLMNVNDARIYFLLMVKCDVIAEKLNVPKGSYIVYHSK